MKWIRDFTKDPLCGKRILRELWAQMHWSGREGAGHCVQRAGPGT